MRRSALFLLFFALFTAPLYGVVYTPETVPYPRANDTIAFVANPDHILSATEVAAIQDVAERLYRLAGVEMVTVALDDIGEAFAFDFSVDLFNRWGIGDKETNTGVLIFFTMQQHDIHITTGDGLEGLLTDAACSQIVYDDIIPLLREGRFGEGLLVGNQAISKRLTTQHALEELMLGYRPKEADEQPWKGLGWASFIVAILALLVYWAAPRCPKCKKKGAKTRDEVIVHATYSAAGRGIHHHTCISCGHKWDEPYKISKLTKSSSSGGSSYGGGGYSGGGSYGGGHTSGGGAGGKW